MSTTMLDKTQLSAMTIAELRKEAVGTYGLPITRDNTKEDIIRAILAHLEHNTGVEYVRAADATATKRTGMSRIRVSNSTNQADFSCRVFHNGLQVSIPFDVYVDIPTETADYINGLTIQKLVKTDDSDFSLDRHVEWVSKYAVSFEWREEGPNPWADKYMTKRREAVLRPKREFFAKNGFWPSDKKLKEWRSIGVG